MLTVAQERGDDFATFQALGLSATGAALIGEMTESAELVTELLRRARLTQNPTALVAAVNYGPARTSRLDWSPTLPPALVFLESNPVDAESSPAGAHPCGCTGPGASPISASGRADRAVPHLTSSLRLADQRFPFVLSDAMLACSRSRSAKPATPYSPPNSTATPRGISPTTLSDYTHTWLQPRLEAVEATLDAAERTAALQSGARLDRRG